jgi:5-hydroxyisourate hydrolase
MDLSVDRRHLIQAGVALAGTTGMAGVASAQAPAPAKLSTHALDMHSGKQAAGMRIAFSKLNGERWELIKTVTADEDGRVKDQLLDSKTIAVGRYELLFFVGEYYKRTGLKLTDPPFLDEIPIRIAIYDATKSYHVPLYFSPWGLMSYRGS